MKKDAYMSDLKISLSGFDADLVQEIVMDYEERFRVGAEKGWSEDEIIQNLGSIENLVAELKEMQNDIGNSTVGKTTSNTISNMQGRTTSHTINVVRNTTSSKSGEKEEESKKQDTGGKSYQEKSFSESFNFVMKKVGRAVDEAMKEAGKAIEGAMERVGSYMEEVKIEHRYDTSEESEVFESSEKDNAQEPNMEQSGQGMEGCTKVVLNAEIADVTVRMTNESETTATCRYYSHKTAMLYPFYAYQKGSTFYAGIRRKQQGQESKSGFFQFSMSPSIEMELLIPEGVEEIELVSASGNMELREIRAEKLNLRSKSGNIGVDRFDGRECCMETMSGELMLEKSKVRVARLSTKSGDCMVETLTAGTVAVNAASGDLNLHGIEAECVVLNTASGDIGNDDIRAETLTINTASGDVEVRNCRGNELHVNAASGDIGVNAECKNYRLQSQSGDVELESRHDADVTASSTSGDVELRMVETEAAYQVEMHSVSGECVSHGQRTVDSSLATPENTRRIQAKTISGDIDVRFL